MILSSIVGFLVLIFILVFIHELGHFTVARLCGVQIDVFSIGFGKALFKYVDKKGTEWRLSAIPLGGYVKMHGDADITSTTSTAELANSEDIKDGSRKSHKDGSQVFSSTSSKAFHSKALWQRFLVVLAGPLANYILAIVIFTGIFCYHGITVIPPVINHVMNNTPASSIGLKSGDLITEVNQRSVESLEDLQLILSTLSDPEIEIKISRNSEIKKYHVQLENKEADDKILKQKTRSMYLGVSFQIDNGYLKKLDLLEALKSSLTKTYNYSYAILKALGSLFTTKNATDNLSGPLQIAKFAGTTLDRGFLTFITFLAIFSINLGLLNLLPIPALDGGTLAMYLYEFFFRKQLSAGIQSILLKIGVAILIFLMLFAFTNDIKMVFFNGKLFQ